MVNENINDLIHKTTFTKVVDLNEGISLINNERIEQRTIERRKRQELKRKTIEETKKSIVLEYK